VSSRERPAVVEIVSVAKDYHGLRPLRIESLCVLEGEVVALSGFDVVTAEVLTNLVTGATLPDRGTVRVFGEDTSATRTADAWLGGLDRFGIVSGRVVLLEGFSVAQNLAIALTLDLDPIPPEPAARVRELASEVELEDGLLGRAAGPTGAIDQLRLRLARALAINPRLLVVEHPTGSLSPTEIRKMAALFRRLAKARGLTALVVSEDRLFAKETSDRRLLLDPKSGSLKLARSWSF
jgi:ABC-type lipoprotein export system ATPase subunit